MLLKRAQRTAMTPPRKPLPAGGSATASSPLWRALVPAVPGQAISFDPPHNRKQGDAFFSLRLPQDFPGPFEKFQNTFRAAIAPGASRVWCHKEIPRHPRETLPPPHVPPPGDPTPPPPAPRPNPRTNAALLPAPPNKNLPTLGLLF